MKHKLFTTLTLLCLGTTSIAQIGIGTDNPNDAAILEIKSTDKGILLPRLESSKISSLDNVQGLMVYCTDCDDSKGVLKINNGTEWVDYVPASGGSFSGNVGIGTSSPSSKLHVDGTVTADGALIEGNTELKGDYGYTLNVIRNYDVSAGNAASDIRMGAIHNGSNVYPFRLYAEVNSSGTAQVFALHMDGTEKWRIDANGNMGIGTTNPLFKLHVEGDINATNLSNSSDKRWKKEIKTLDNSLNKITALRGVSYEWNHDEFPDKNFSEGTQIGVIAQEVESVFPELVHTDTEGFKSVSYSNLVAPLIEAIKELKQQNENFRIRIESLEAQLKN